MGQMREKRLFWGCVAVSVLMHGVVAVLWPEFRERAPVRFEVELLKAPAEPHIAEPRIADAQPPVPPPAKPERAPDVPKATVEAATSEPAPSETTSRPTARLNLNRPDWATFDQTNQADANSTFYPRQEALAQRRAEQRRNRVLATRAIEREGLSPDAYAAVDPQSEVVKTSRGCFKPHDEVDMAGGGRRWWRVGCKERRADPWSQPPLELGANGQALVEESAIR